jgi:hypothetical protein
MFISIAVVAALAAQVGAPPPVSPPKVQPSVSQDADWRLLARLPDRWVFIQGEKSRTKDLSKIVFSLTVYLKPIDVAGYSIDHVLDAEHFECDPRKAELRSRISFEVNGGMLATNYGGISEPVTEGTLALLKVTTVCDNLPLSGPGAPSDKLAVGLAKGLSSQLPPADLEKLAPMGGWTVFNPPAPNIKP